MLINKNCLNKQFLGGGKPFKIKLICFKHNFVLIFLAFVEYRNMTHTSQWMLSHLDPRLYYGTACQRVQGTTDTRLTWSLDTPVGNTWSLDTLVGYTWSLDTLVGNTWFLDTLVGNTWSVDTLVGNTWSLDTPVGNTWALDTPVGYTWSFDTLVGNTWSLDTPAGDTWSPYG